MKTGWIKDINSLTRWTDSEETERLVTLIGGPDKVMAAAQKALKENDPRWAITLTQALAQGLVTVNGDNKPADRMAELMMP